MWPGRSNGAGRVQRAGPVVHDGLALLLERLPPHVTVAIGTRVDPPLGLGRLRVRGRLVEFHADDLRFQPAEAGVLLGVTHYLDDAQIQRLCARTEGWAAGLVLVGLSLRRGGDPATVGGDDLLVVDYLTDELLDELADHDRDLTPRLGWVAVTVGTAGLAGAVVAVLVPPSTLVAVAILATLVFHLATGARWTQLTRS